MEVVKSLGSSIAQRTENFAASLQFFTSAKKLPQCGFNPQTSLSSYDSLVQMADHSIGMEWDKQTNCKADARKSFLEVVPCRAC